MNRAWAGIKVAIGAVVQWFQQTAWPIIQTVIGYIVGYYKMLWTVFSTVVGWIVTKGGALLGFFTELPGKISAAVTGLWDGLKTSFRSAVNWIIDHWNGLQLRLGGQHISLPFGQSFDIPSITLDTPNIPRLAAGGIVAHRPGGVLAILGEGRYDEQVTPLDGRSGGFVMNVYVQGDTDPAGAARRIVQIINEARDNGTLRWA